MLPIEPSRDIKLSTTARNFTRKCLVQMGLGAMRQLLLFMAGIVAFSVLAHAQEAGTDPFEAQATTTTNTIDSGSALPAPAAVPDTSAQSAVDAELFQQLREKQSRILVLESEVKEAELRRKLAELAAPTSALPLGLDLSNPAAAATYKSFPVQATDTSGSDSSPYVLKLNGSLGHMSALILMPDNSIINARPNMKLPNGWRVGTIDADGVSAFDRDDLPVRLGISAGQVQPGIGATDSTSAQTIN